MQMLIELDDLLRLQLGEKFSQMFGLLIAINGTTPTFFYQPLECIKVHL